MFEVGSGHHSPPKSPLLLGRQPENARSNTASSENISNVDRPGRQPRSLSARRGAAANAITEECERLFCGTLRAVFMGEMGLLLQDSLVVGSPIDHHTPRMPEAPDKDKSGFEARATATAVLPSRERGLSFASASSYSSRGSDVQSAVFGGLGTPSSVTSSELESRRPSETAPILPRYPSLIKHYMEMWDYTGGARFKGFTTTDNALVVFFDSDVIGKQTKQSLMALIELASTSHLSCDQLVVCLERHIDDTANNSIMRDLRWIGFEPTTLARWSRGFELTSDRWVFLGMEI